MINRAIFLDRDGTLNYDSPDYIKNIDEFKLFPRVAETLANFTKLGYLNIIISNQSGLARGLISKPEIQKINQDLIQNVESANGRIDGIYYCPHHPDACCSCRKPRTGLLQKAMRDHDIDPELSFFIGDSPKDILTGKAVGCKTILVQSGYTTYSAREIDEWFAQPDFIIDNLFEACKIICQNEEKE